MGATRTLAADSAGEAMDATAAGMEEIELRTKDPLRMYRIWRKVGPRSLFATLKGCGSRNWCESVLQTIGSHVSGDTCVAFGFSGFSRCLGYLVVRVFRVEDCNPGT